MFQSRITASELGSTLTYAEGVLGSRDFHLFHGIRDRRVDFRAVVARLIDLGAPIADWRFDLRVLGLRIPGDMPVHYEGDVRRYGGEAAEDLRAIRREHEKRLIDWLFAETPPVAPKGDEFRVCAALISWMPSVEEFVDGLPARAVAA